MDELYGEHMNKTLLICGSILAVVLIVLASFTSVVGFQSTKSRLVDSPLFGIRTRNALGSEEQNVIAYEYVGNGREILIPLPKRDIRTLLIQKAIDKLRKMDDKEFSRFVAIVIHRIREQNIVKEHQISMVREALLKLKANPEILKYSESVGELTHDVCVTQDPSPPLCMLGFIIAILAGLFVLVIIIIQALLE
jgi:hypothetical protein